METSMRVTDSPVCPAYSALDLLLPACLHLQGLAVTTSAHLIATGLRPVRPKARFRPLLTRLWSLRTPASDPRAPQKSTSVLPGFSPLAGCACGHLPTTLLCCPPRGRGGPWPSSTLPSLVPRLLAGDLPSSLPASLPLLPCLFSEEPSAPTRFLRGLACSLLPRSLGFSLTAALTGQPAHLPGTNLHPMSLCPLPPGPVAPEQPPHHLPIRLSPRLSPGCPVSVPATTALSSPGCSAQLWKHLLPGLHIPGASHTCDRRGHGADTRFSGDVVSVSPGGWGGCQACMGPISAETQDPDLSELRDRVDLRKGPLQTNPGPGWGGVPTRGKDPAWGWGTFCR